MTDIHHPHDQIDLAPGDEEEGRIGPRVLGYVIGLGLALLFTATSFFIAGTDLVTVGYGKDKPKDPSAPMDPINRRVQVVNMDTKTASK